MQELAQPVPTAVPVRDRRSRPRPPDAAPGDGVAPDDTETAMLAATALGLSIAPRAGAVGILRHLADSGTSALLAARLRLDQLRDVDEVAIEQARSLLQAAAGEGQSAG